MGGNPAVDAGRQRGPLNAMACGLTQNTIQAAPVLPTTGRIIRE